MCLYLKRKEERRKDRKKKEKLKLLKCFEEKHTHVEKFSALNVNSWKSKKNNLNAKQA